MTAAFRLPSKSGLDSLSQANLILLLQEKLDDGWSTKDSVRLAPLVRFPSPPVGGESANLKLFLEGKPTLKLDDDTASVTLLTASGAKATLRIPKVVNSDLVGVILREIEIIQCPAKEYYGQQCQYKFKQDKEDLAIFVGPKSEKCR